MTKLQYEDIIALTRLSQMSTDEFLDAIWKQWDIFSDKTATLIARAIADGVDPEHEDAVKDMLRVGIRCNAVKTLIKMVQGSPDVRAAFEPSDTELQMQCDEFMAAAAKLHEQED